MHKEASSYPGFVRGFLISAALILAVTAVGKAIAVPDSFPNLCLEEPILGPLQLHATNQLVYALASLIEFGIVGLIVFCRRRWLPCLACSVWGGLCLLVHLIFLGPDALASCNCLGWFQQIIPLPKEVLSAILLACAVWLALGGLAAFCFSWQRARLGLLLLALAAIGIMAALWWGIRYYDVNPHAIRYYDELSMEPHAIVRSVFFVTCGGVIALSIGLYSFGKRRKLPPRPTRD